VGRLDITTFHRLRRVPRAFLAADEGPRGIGKPHPTLPPIEFAFIRGAHFARAIERHPIRVLSSLAASRHLLERTDFESMALGSSGSLQMNSCGVRPLRVLSRLAKFDEVAQVGSQLLVGFVEVASVASLMVRSIRST
jgi:hypothetical protein